VTLDADRFRELLDGRRALATGGSTACAINISQHHQWGDDDC
jgi:hypothetical protein